MSFPPLPIESEHSRAAPLSVRFSIGYLDYLVTIGSNAVWNGSTSSRTLPLAVLKERRRRASLKMRLEGASLKDTVAQLEMCGVRSVTARLASRIWCARYGRARRKPTPEDKTARTQQNTAPDARESIFGGG